MGCTHERADEERASCPIVVKSGSNHVPVLVSTAVAYLGLNGNQVRPEIAAERVHRETLSIRGLDNRWCQQYTQLKGAQPSREHLAESSGEQNVP